MLFLLLRVHRVKLVDTQRLCNNKAQLINNKCFSAPFSDIMFDKIKDNKIMKSKWTFMTIGLVVGMLVLSGIMVAVMKTSADDLMLNEHKSQFSTVDETVQAIYDGVAAFNAAHTADVDIVGKWGVIDVLNVSEGVAEKNANYSDMKETVIVSLCNANIAYDMLGEDDRRQIAAIMPCAIGVYEKADGIYVSGFNMDLMASIMPSDISGILELVADADAEILSHVVEH